MDGIIDGSNYVGKGDRRGEVIDFNLVVFTDTCTA